MEIVEISTEFIRLDALLKFLGIAATGGEAKIRIKNGDIKVNGVLCLERGKKIKNGDRIEENGNNILVKWGNSP